MHEWAWVLLWWLIFAGSHLLLSAQPLRGALIARFSQKGFMGLYSIISLVTFVLLVMAYWPHRHAGPLLWDLRSIPGIMPLATLLSALAWMIIVAANMQPSPVGLAPGASRSARGLTRITRHPLFMGLGLWGLAHCLLNGYASDVIFFGGFAVFAIIGGAHQDQRQRLNPPLQAFYDETSLLPFGAILAGRNRLVAAELPWKGFAVGLIVAALLYGAHFWLRH